jgi:hypothetical protein
MISRLAESCSLYKDGSFERQGILMVILMMLRNL